MDETFTKVHGRWRYLYRAIDRDGNLVDVVLSEHRDLAAAKAFFRSAKSVTEVFQEGRVGLISGEPAPLVVVSRRANAA